MPRKEMLVLTLIYKKENVTKFRNDMCMPKRRVRHSGNLNIPLSSPGGLTGHFSSLLLIFFPSCLLTALEGHLGQDSHELRV